MSSFYFYRWNQFKVIPLACELRTRNLPKFSATSDVRYSVNRSQSSSTIESRDTRHRRMQEVNSLFRDIQALRAKYCIVGTLHNTTI